MLELHDVIIRPRQNTISLTLNDGRLACISGPKGAGKTAVLRAILGLQPIDGGHISIDGELLTPLSASYFRRFMAYVPSELRLIPGQDRISDIRKMLYGLSVNSHIRDDEPKDTRLWTELTPVRQYMELVKCVSKLHRRLVLIDEPESDLDALTAYAFVEYLHQMTASGSSVLVVSNTLPALNVTDYVIEL